jgi:hypothetical protein
MLMPMSIGQNTAAARLLFQKRGKVSASRLGGTRRRNPRPPKRRAIAAKRSRTSTARPARMVKGSAAAKRYMAMLRKKRK